MTRVRVNATYVYDPVLLDLVDPPHGVKDGLLHSGDVVIVKNRYGCPKAGAMGHCYIASPITGGWLGLVSVNSLRKK